MSLVLLRHAESTWNQFGRFTGCADPPLSRRGEQQAAAAGRLFSAESFAFDRVYTSALTRAVRTAEIVLGVMHASHVRIREHSRLNERNLGVLEGCTKAEVVHRWGNEQRKRWRDQPWVAPPGGESRSDADRRVLDVWHEEILSDLGAGRTVLVVAHTGSLRALLGHIGHPGGTIGNAVALTISTEALVGETGACCDVRQARTIGSLVR